MIRCTIRVATQAIYATSLIQPHVLGPTRSARFDRRATPRCAVLVILRTATGGRMGRRRGGSSCCAGRGCNFRAGGCRISRGCFGRLRGCRTSGLDNLAFIGRSVLIGATHKTRATSIGFGWCSSTQVPARHALVGQGAFTQPLISLQSTCGSIGDPVSVAVLVVFRAASYGRRRGSMGRRRSGSNRGQASAWSKNGH